MVTQRQQKAGREGEAVDMVCSGPAERAAYLISQHRRTGSLARRAVTATMSLSLGRLSALHPTKLRPACNPYCHVATVRLVRLA